MKNQLFICIIYIIIKAKKKYANTNIVKYINIYIYRNHKQ